MHGLRPIKLHELRDTHGSLLVQNGVNLKVVQERLGHSSPRITLDRYAHVITSMGREAAELAGSLVKSDGNGMSREDRRLLEPETPKRPEKRPAGAQEIPCQGPGAPCHPCRNGSAGWGSGEGILLAREVLGMPAW